MVESDAGGVKISERRNVKKPLLVGMHLCPFAKLNIRVILAALTLNKIHAPVRQSHCNRFRCLQFLKSFDLQS